MIHSGLRLNFKGPHATASHCCLQQSSFPVDVTTKFWDDPQFIPLREKNKQNVWDPECINICRGMEAAGQHSFRTGMNSAFGEERTVSTGPKRIDLMFDISCNLACRTCGPWASTFWQKHLKENGKWKQLVASPQSQNDIVLALKNLDLSNLQMLVFCGGETLLGQTYWEIARWLADAVPYAKQQLTLCFQTNGTQPIHSRNYELIDKFKLVKLHFSLDGCSKQFEYLRWPASWNQVVSNIMQIRETAPSNVMFHVEETVSIFNLFYLNALEAWTSTQFTTNREGDVINHNKHVATGKFSLVNCTQEYVDAMQNSRYRSLIPAGWKETPSNIASMISEIKQFDTFRNQSFEQTFPEVAEFYHRYL